MMLYVAWCKCGANHIIGRFSFWRSSHPSTSSFFSTKNVSSIRIFARGNPGAVRTVLKMYAFLRTKYLRIAAGLGIRYPFKISKLNYIYAACFFHFRRASARAGKKLRVYVLSFSSLFFGKSQRIFDNICN